MHHPFQAMTETTRWWTGGVLLVVALIVRKVMAAPQAQSPAAPHGTLSLALTGNRAEANTITSSWDAGTRTRVATNLSLDMLFSVAWTTSLALACVAAADRLRRRSWPLSSMGAVLAWSQGIAMVLAIVKDVVLLIFLRSDVPTPLLRLTRWCTVIEMTIKGIGVVYALVGALAWGTNARSRTDTL